MKLLKIILLIFLISFTVQLDAQDTIQQDPNLGSRQIDKVSIGIGAGLDFGGFGGNVINFPIKNVGIFGGVGYALAGAEFQNRLFPVGISVGYKFIIHK